jgi:hypothetical protein
MEGTLLHYSPQIFLFEGSGRFKKRCNSCSYIFESIMCAPRSFEMASIISYFFCGMAYPSTLKCGTVSRPTIWCSCSQHLEKQNGLKIRPKYSSNTQRSGLGFRVLRVSDDTHKRKKMKCGKRGHATLVWLLVLHSVNTLKKKHQKQG